MDLLLSNPKYIAIFCFALGFAMVLFVGLVFSLFRRAQIKAEVDELLTDARERAAEIDESAKQKVDAFIDEYKTRAQAEIDVIEERIEKIELRIKDRESQLDEKLHSHEKRVSETQSSVDIYDNKVTSVERRVDQRRQMVRDLKNELIKKLESKTEASLDEVKSELQKKLLDDKQIESSKYLQTADEEANLRVETDAKKLLTMAINRFARAYCPERGIGYLNFENDEQKSRVLKQEQIFLREIEKHCGVDLAYDEQNNAINVYGFDPVRRELGRATVEKLMNDKRIEPKQIESLVKNVKKDLFQKIMKDGDKIAKELKIDGLNTEIKNMMGALRYRYSFTQNQYFHCAEVGFLCGLLASELDVPLKQARRAGLLHDIGKAMDHSIEGGHAVIGADFIQQHGESSEIVHAVRAHHFDEQPSTNLAFLVIAADAISGARPGARRSTVASYTQKIEDLQTIARSFDGVIDTHVLSAGREVRVYVDGKRLDDLKALTLSQEIAHKIENDMQYPGQIKVTVVRETQAVEYAR